MPPRPTPMETLPTTADEVRLIDGRLVPSCRATIPSRRASSLSS